MSKTERIDIYTILGWIAIVAVPVAPAFYFGFEFAQDVYGNVLAWPAPWQAALVVGVFIGLVSAAGLELVGILSGHNAIRFLSRNELEKTAACAIILIAYVGLGISGLENLLAKGVVMFLVAPLVYLLVAMQKTLDTVEAQEQTAAQDDIAWKRQQDTARAQREHEARMRQLELEAQNAAALKEAENQFKLEEKRIKQEAELAKLEASQAARRAASSATSGRPNGEIVAAGFDDWRTIPDEVKHRMADMTTSEIRENNPAISPRTARDWKQRADELAGKVSANGVVK